MFAAVMGLLSRYLLPVRWWVQYHAPAGRGAPGDGSLLDVVSLSALDVHIVILASAVQCVGHLMGAGSANQTEPSGA